MEKPEKPELAGQPLNNIIISGMTPAAASAVEPEYRVEIVKRGNSVIMLNKNAIKSCSRPKSSP